MNGNFSSTSISPHRWQAAFRTSKVATVDYGGAGRQSAFWFKKYVVADYMGMAARASYTNKSSKATAGRRSGGGRNQKVFRTHYPPQAITRTLKEVCCGTSIHFQRKF